MPTGLWHNVLEWGLRAFRSSTHALNLQLSASTPLRDYRVVSTTVSPAGSPFVSNYEHKVAQQMLILLFPLTLFAA